MVYSLQQRTFMWAKKCFGIEHTMDKRERAYRFLEESLELVQALDISKEDVTLLVEYVFDRPKGEIHQEIGGVLVTLNVLVNAITNLSIVDLGELELQRCWENIEKIRQKQLAKRQYSPLPGGPT